MRLQLTRECMMNTVRLLNQDIAPPGHQMH